MGASSTKPPFEVGQRGRELERALVERLERLATDVDALQANDQFRHLLLGRARLWRYGFLNQMLIAVQRPEASWVAGARQWERQGRTVRAGQDPIWIAAPSRPQRPWPFFGVKVYDVTQTDGPALPSTAAAYRGDAAVLARIEAAAPLLGLTVEEVDSLGFGEGTVTLGEAHPGGRVRVLRGSSPLERCRVLVHEYAHEVLHVSSDHARALRSLPREAAILEAEADATAFAVLGDCGLEFNAPAYVAWQGGRGKDILRSLRRIVAAARRIRAAIEGEELAVRIPPLRLHDAAALRPNSRRVHRRIPRTR